MAATGQTADGITASAPGRGYHVNHVGVGPLPGPVIAFGVRVTGQPGSAHVTEAAREVLSARLPSLSREALGVHSPGAQVAMRE
jgi:hypothetical protein